MTMPIWKMMMYTIFMTINEQGFFYSVYRFPSTPLPLTLKRLGVAFKAPLDISRDYSATRKALTTTLYDFFLLSFPHILTSNL